MRLLTYLFYGLITLIWTAYLALFLHPAKQYIIPGMLGGMGLTEKSFGATLLLSIIPAVLTIIVLALLLVPSRRRSARQRVMLGLMVMVGIILTGYQGFLKSQPGGWQMPPGNVMAQTVALMPFADRIEALGTATANESTSITSNVSETVRAITVSEGQFVTKGTVLVQLQDDEERAGLIEAEKAFNRSATLVRTSAISPARLDSDRARLDIARAQVADRQIRAPFDGILGLRSISAGDVVAPGAMITTIDDIDPIKVEFSIPESYVGSVAPGQVIEARSEAYRGKIFSGLVTAIDPRVDPATRALRLKAEIPNPDGKLRAGMLLKTEIRRDERQQLAVSEEAIISMGTQKSVMVLGASEKKVLDPSNPKPVELFTVEARPVTIGTRQPGYVEILTGLKEGERVVVDGVIKAQPGGQVVVVGDKKIADTVQRAYDNALPGKQLDLQDMGAVATPNELPEPEPASGE